MVETPYGGDTPGATQGEIGGPRHYEGPTLGQLTSWKCPACAQENTGPLDAGCSHCGAGSARPRHVGVPPRADRRPIVVPDVPTYAAHVTGFQDPTTIAFEAWLEARINDDENPAGVAKLRNILLEAWMGAVNWYQSTLSRELTGQTGPPTIDAPAPSDRIPVPIDLIRRVVSTLEATTDLPDEQQSPELLALISELKELLE